MPFQTGEAYSSLELLREQKSISNVRALEHHTRRQACLQRWVAYVCYMYTETLLAVEEYTKNPYLEDVLKRIRIHSVLKVRDISFSEICHEDSVWSINQKTVARATCHIECTSSWSLAQSLTLRLSFKSFITSTWSISDECLMTASTSLTLEVTQ